MAQSSQNSNKDTWDDNQPGKTDVELIESTETGVPATYVDTVASRISKPHQDYLMQRHGTLELQPVPSMDPADPYNWPGWKVGGDLSVIFCFLRLADMVFLETYKLGPCGVPCLHGYICRSRNHSSLPYVRGIPRKYHYCLFTDSANSIAEEYGIPIQKASYLTSLQIAILGGAPLFWKPLSNRYGRRPIFIISLVCSLVCNVGCAKSTDYASTAACRALQAFFISPASGEFSRHGGCG